MEVMTYFNDNDLLDHMRAVLAAEDKTMPTNCFCQDDVDIPIAQSLSNVTEDAYSVGGIMDGYVELLNTVASALNDAMEEVEFTDYNGEGNITIGACGVGLDEIFAGTVETNYICDLQEDCSCEAPDPFCVMITNISVIPTQTEYWWPYLDDNGTIINETLSHNEDSVEVSFIIVSRDLDNQNKQRQYTEYFDQVLEHALVSFDDAPSFMKTYALEWNAVDNWDAILYPEESNTNFRMGYRSHMALCYAATDATCTCRTGVDNSEGPIGGTTTSTTTQSMPLYAGIGAGGAALVAAVAAIAYYRSQALAMSHLQVYQKEVFYEALNRNRATEIKLLDTTDGARYTVDPDNLGV